MQVGSIVETTMNVSTPLYATTFQSNTLTRPSDRLTPVSGWIIPIESKGIVVEILDDDALIVELDPELDIWPDGPRVDRKVLITLKWVREFASPDEYFNLDSRVTVIKAATTGPRRVYLGRHATINRVVFRRHQLLYELKFDSDPKLQGLPRSPDIQWTSGSLAPYDE